MSLRIAVDARPLANPGTGIYRYTCELVRRLCSKGAYWYLYSTQSYDQQLIKGDNVVHRNLSVPCWLGGRQAGQWLYPLWATYDKVDVFWSPRHHLPLLLSRRVNTVLSVHDLVWKNYGSSMTIGRRILERLLMPGSIRKADSVITGTETVAGEISTTFPGVGEKLKVISYANGIEDDGRRMKSHQQSREYFLFVGTMEPRKNLRGLLQGYKLYVTRVQNPHALVVVGGDGWGGVDPQQMVEEFALHDHVKICGKVSDSAITGLYEGARALVMPSFYEGFGLPIVEAMARGVPVIVSGGGAMEEVAAEAAYTVNPENHHTIYEALCVVGSDASLHARLSKAALVRSRDFDWGRSADDLFSLMQALK